MRQLLLLSFALLPVAAHAQMNTLSSVAPAPTSTSIMSSSTTVSATHVKAAGKPEVDSSTPLISTRQTLRTTVDSDFAYPEEAATATLGSPNFVETPKLEKFSTIPLSQSELAKQPEETSVAVTMNVDVQGVPHDLRIEHSAGSEIDADALATASQYRFKPASVDHVPVASTVTVNVTIAKK